MNGEEKEQIRFEVETSRILDLLSKEIYDSPNALLRENVQNAYDAILMRCTGENEDIRRRLIEIRVEPGRVTIKDDGIGMTDDVLRNNFWRAGSSGKQTDLARRSGVVGTFGIGAMANFGVCTQLTVETRSLDSEVTLVSTAERDKLSISEKCIELTQRRDDRPSGTTIIAELDPSDALDEATARSYLEPYVRFLPVKVLLNGQPISQHSYIEEYIVRVPGAAPQPTQKFAHNSYTGDLELFFYPTGLVSVHVTNLKLGDGAIVGELFLMQNGGQLMGLRNYFGLAPLPISGYYQFGGVANLSILEPTAGREALSRESIERVNSLLNIVESEVTEVIADTDTADRNNGFLHYISDNHRPELAKRVTIEVLPAKENIALGLVAEVCTGKTMYYYSGRDPSILQTFASDESYLLHVSQSNPRRNVQSQYIGHILKVDQVPDQPTIIKEYSASELTIEETALVIKVVTTLGDDYLLSDVEVYFADISHSVTILVDKKGDTVFIYIARDAIVIQPVLECYRNAYEVFGGFVKDFVRMHLYQRVADFLPSSTREGADALLKVLQRNRELFRYEESERGFLEPILAEYLSGQIDLSQVLKTARKAQRSQAQTVSRDQVGHVEQELLDVVQVPTESSGERDGSHQYDPAPPILRPEVTSRMKIFIAERKYPQLNDFELLLGLSDRLFKREGDFFREPHTTKLIWGEHRVIYIFTHASGRLTLYYDIELKRPLADKSAGGEVLPTTTLITGNRIYIPVPDQLIPAFEIVDKAKEFFVRFDTLASQPT